MKFQAFFNFKSKSTPEDRKAKITYTDFSFRNKQHNLRQLLGQIQSMELISGKNIFKNKNIMW